MAFDLNDYKDVSERISEFIARYPEGTLQTELERVEREGVIIGWLCRASAYRGPDDPRPGIGHAFEPVPGKTPYTRDSEAMNSETSAWGRAIIALGFTTKKIASKQEVQARRKPSAGTDGPAAVDPVKEAPISVTEVDPVGNYPTQPQRQRLFAIAKECGVKRADLRSVLAEVTGQESTAQIPIELYDKVIEGIRAKKVTVVSDG
jgi:hypothetical protein